MEAGGISTSGLTETSHYEKWREKKGKKKNMNIIVSGMRWFNTCSAVINLWDGDFISLQAAGLHRYEVLFLTVKSTF